MNLDDIRQEIDEIDTKLTELFVKRMKLSKDVAIYKKEKEIKIFDETREKAVRDKVSTLSGEEMAEYTDELYSKIFEISKSYQSRIIDQFQSCTNK